MKTLYRIGMAALLALGLAVSAEARVGGWSSGKLAFASEGNFSHDNSTTASVFVGAEIRKNQLADGAVIVMEAYCTIGTVNTEGATLTIGCYLGGTDMLTSVVVQDDGRLYVKAVGVVRSVGTAGTILWSIASWPENTTAAAAIAPASYVFSSDTTADTVDTTLDPLQSVSGNRGQELGLSFDWTAADAANTLDVEALLIWIY